MDLLQVDGFRFDLMGYMMKSTICGEGWDFGEVANNGCEINASQINLSGSAIGSFNGRIRDALLGGSPSGHPLQQEFLKGLSLQPNSHDHGTDANAAHVLALSKDHIPVGMSANLKDFVLTNCDGQEDQRFELMVESLLHMLHNQWKTINYVSAHDNETLFDIISLKTPMEISVDARCRINHLATSIIALSEGVPFFHWGDEILRSKSLDRNSYNSGDWFNRIKPRLTSPSFKPQKSHIISALENFQNLLRIRYSSILSFFEDCKCYPGIHQERVRFHNTGQSYVPGVIVMSIEDGHEGVPGLSQLDPIYSYIVVVINACPTDISFTSPILQEKVLQLHALQMMSNDTLVKNSTYHPSSDCFRLPSRTTAVFVELRNT